MIDDNFRKNKEVKHKNRVVVLEASLSINKELFDENKISYKMFKNAEENILKELKTLI